MDFFGIGSAEVLLILVVALIIWGPGRIVDIGRTLGKTVRTIRKATFDLTSEVTKELDLAQKDHRSPPKEKTSHENQGPDNRH